MHNIIAIPAAQYFYLLTIGGHGYGHRFYVPFSNTMKFSFVLSAIRLWNQLSNHLATAVSRIGLLIINIGLGCVILAISIEYILSFLYFRQPLQLALIYGAVFLYLKVRQG